MERVGILVNKLQEQLQQQADVDRMLVIAQMLYTELLQEKESLKGNYDSRVAVSAPNNPPLYELPIGEPESISEIEAVEITPALLREEVIEPAVLPVEEITVEEERKVIDIPSAFVYDNVQEVHPTSRWAFDPVDIPTLAQQEKVVYHLKEEGAADGSLNDKLKEEKTELGSILQDAPIRDLKKAISINDRHRFIDALFRGDETMYERSIKTINNFSIYAEAEFWMQRELKLKLGWDNNLPEVKLFDQLVKRRFS
jgi:hypothetical protein